MRCEQRRLRWKRRRGPLIRKGGADQPPRQHGGCNGQILTPMQGRADSRKIVGEPQRDSWRHESKINGCQAPERCATEFGLSATDMNKRPYRGACSVLALLGIMRRRIIALTNLIRVKISHSCLHQMGPLLVSNQSRFIAFSRPSSWRP